MFLREEISCPGIQAIKSFSDTNIVVVKGRDLVTGEEAYRFLSTSPDIVSVAMNANSCSDECLEVARKTFAYKGYKEYNPMFSVWTCDITFFYKADCVSSKTKSKDYNLKDSRVISVDEVTVAALPMISDGSINLDCSAEIRNIKRRIEAQVFNRANEWLSVSGNLVMCSLDPYKLNAIKAAR